MPQIMLPSSFVPAMFPEHREMVEQAVRWLDISEPTWSAGKQRYVPIDRLEYARELVAAHRRRSGLAEPAGGGTMPGAPALVQGNSIGGPNDGQQEAGSEGA